MANTPVLQLPYPVPADSVDVPRDIQALAVALDTRYGGGGAGGGGPLQSAPVLDVGLAGQIRAGRQLAVADFTALGLSTPVGLFNLSGLTNLGSGGALVNKGTVPFGVGINGTAATAAVFAGSTGQALYIADTGAADPFRIKTGSWGCWFRTAKRGAAQHILAKGAAAPQRSWSMATSSLNQPTAAYTADGTTIGTVIGVSDVCDDRWHFVVATHDATALRLYADGVLEAVLSIGWPNFGGAGPLNIGGIFADASIANAEPFYGRVDEAFVTADVLSEDQVRALYCAKVAHGYATTPTRISLNVRRRKRGGPLASADFPTQPLRLHNFTAGALTDAGSNGVTITNNLPATILPVAGADGASSEAFTFPTGAHGGLSSTDAGLPATTAARSYGCWFKCSPIGNITIIGWGTVSTADARAYVVTAGTLAVVSAGDAITGPFVADGQWHFLTVTEDNAAGDGVRRKAYIDGRLVGGSTVMNSITLAGANRFRVGANPDGTGSWVGQIDGAFVCGYALTMEQVAALYAKGSQALAPSPKNEGDHVEAMDATNLLAVFDTLDSTAQVDMGVAS